MPKASFMENVKPDNILINNKQEIEWIDFEREKATAGFARWTKTMNRLSRARGKIRTRSALL